MANLRGPTRFQLHAALPLRHCGGTIKVEPQMGRRPGRDARDLQRAPAATPIFPTWCFGLTELLEAALGCFFYAMEMPSGHASTAGWAARPAGGSVSRSGGVAAGRWCVTGHYRARCDSRWCMRGAHREQLQQQGGVDGARQVGARASHCTCQACRRPKARMLKEAVYGAAVMGQPMLILCALSTQIRQVDRWCTLGGPWQR